MRTILILALVVSTASVQAQQLRTITTLPGLVNETSGIEAKSVNSIWTFNDSGGQPEIYQCDTLGNHIKTIQIEGTWNRDWEDIAWDDDGNMYIGNIGNNFNNTTDLSVFKIPNPENIQGSTVQAEVIYFSYEDQTAFPPAASELNFDCETLFWFDGHLYLCSKNRTEPFDGMTYLYRFSDQPGTYVAEKIGEFDTGGWDTFNFWITAGDVSPDGSKMAILSSNKMWVFYNYKGDDFFGGEHVQINFPSSTQKEALVFPDNDQVYITDEDWGDQGRALYSVKLTSIGQPVEVIVHPVPGLIQAEEYDNGGSGVGYYDLSGGNEGGQFRSDDVDIEASVDDGGGFNVGWFEPGEWLQYTMDVTYDGTYDLHMRTASQFNGTFYIEVDQQKVGESMEVLASGDWQNWQTTTFEDIPLPAGEHTLRVVMESGGFNLNHLEFETGLITGVSSTLDQTLEVFPNPATDRFEIKFPGGGNLVVRNVVGRVVLAQNVGASAVVQTDQWPSGAYYFTLETGAGVQRGRLVVQ